MTVQKTSKPTVAGILIIIAAGFHLVGGIFIVSLIFAVGSEQLYNGFFMGLFPPEIQQFAQVAYGFSAFFCVLAIVLELMGGIYAFKRKLWVIVLISSVVACMAIFPIGIPAIAFTVMSKNEFES